MNKLLNNWGPKALIIVGLVVLFAKGGTVLVGALIRFAIPLLVIYSGYRLVRGFFVLGNDHRPTNKGENQGSRNGHQSTTTIEICSQCGHEKGNIRCSHCRL